MKLLADENIPLETVELLEESGHDVLSILRKYSGISDSEIIHLSIKEERLIIKFDKDFAFHVFAEGLLPKKGGHFLKECRTCSRQNCSSSNQTSSLRLII